MNYLKAIFCLLALGCMIQVAVASIAINLSQDTTPGMADHLVVSYSSAATYGPPLQNLWNSHVFTLRWPDSLGANVICGLTDIHNFQFATDPGSQGSPYLCGNHYYQKFVTLAFAKPFSLNLGQTIEMFKIRMCLPDSIVCGFFELADCPDACVVSNFGCASINNAFLGEQFCSIGVGAPACQPLQSIEPTVFASPVDHSYIRVAVTQMRDSDWESCQLMRSTDGHRFDLVNLWVREPDEEENVLIFEDKRAQPGQRYYYRAQLRQASDALIQTSTVHAQLSPKENYFRVFPIPTHGKVYLEGYLYQASRIWIAVTDMAGRELFSQQALAEKGLVRQNFSIAHLPKGRYFLRVQSEEGNLLSQVIFLE